MTKFIVFRVYPDQRNLKWVCNLSGEASYSSTALKDAIDRNLVAEPGRYLVIRLDPINNTPIEAHQYDVDYEHKPLKILHNLRNDSSSLSNQ